MSVYNTGECDSNSTQCDTNDTKYHVLITNKSKCFKDCQPESNVHLRNESLKVFDHSNSFDLGAKLNWQDKTVLNSNISETSNTQWKEKTRETSHTFCHHNTCFRNESSLLFSNDKQINYKEMNTSSLNRETCFDKELFSFVNNDLNADTKSADNFIGLSHLFESFYAATREEDNNLCMTPDSLIVSTNYNVDKQNNEEFDRGLYGDEIENYHDANANQMSYLHDMSTGDNAVLAKDLRLPFNDNTMKANEHSNNRLLFLQYLLQSEARVTHNKKRGAALKRMRQLRKLQSKRNLKKSLTCRRLSLCANKDDPFLQDVLNIKQIKPMMKHTKTQQYLKKHDMKSSSRIDHNCTVLNDIELSSVSLQSPEILMTSSSLNTFDKLSDMSSSSLSPDSLETLNSVTESVKDFSPYGTLQLCQVFTTDANIKPNQHNDSYEDVIISNETTEKDGTYITSAESALSLSSTSEVSSNNLCNPMDRAEITISQVAPSVCVNESNAVLCAAPSACLNESNAPQINVQDYLVEIIGNSLISDSSNIYMTSIIKSLGLQHSLTSNEQKESVSTLLTLEKIERTQSDQILDGSNVLYIKPKPIQKLSTSTHLEQRTSPTQKVSGDYLLTKEELKEDIVLEKPNAKVSQSSSTLKRKGPFVCNPSNPAQYRYQSDVQLRKKLRPYKCIMSRKVCLNPRTKSYTARAHVVSTITGTLTNNVLISRKNKKEEIKKKDCKKDNTSEMAAVKHQLLKTTKNISKSTDILDSCCQFPKQRKHQTSNNDNFYWQDKRYVKKHCQRRKMHISKRKKANLLWKRKIVKNGDNSRKRTLNTSLEKCTLSKSMHCDQDEANTRCKHLVKFKEQKLKNKIFLNTSTAPEALQFQGTDKLNNSNQSELPEQFQLLTPALMSNQNSTSTGNSKKCQSAIQQDFQLKSEFHSTPSSKHKNELTLLGNQCDDAKAVDNRLQISNQPKVFRKPKSNIPVNEFNRSHSLINQQNISKSSSNQFYVFNYTKRTNHVQRSESLVNHLRRSESSVVNLNRAKSLVNQLGGPKPLDKKVENTSVSILCGPNTSISKLCGPNTSVSKLCGPNTSISKLCGLNSTVRKLSGPDTSVNLKQSAVYTSIRQKSSVRQVEGLKTCLNPCNKFKDSVTDNNQSKHTAIPRVDIQSARKKAQPLLDKESTTKTFDVKETEKKNTSLQKSLGMKDVFSRLWVSHSKCIGDISHLCCQLLKDVTNSNQICTFNINDIKRLWNLNRRFNTKCSNKLINYADSKKLDYCLKKKKAIDVEDASDNRGIIACIQMILKKQSIALQAIDNVLQILQVSVQDVPEPLSRDDISNKFDLREHLKHEKQNLFSEKHSERYFPSHRIIQKLNTCSNVTSTSSKSLRTQQCNVEISY